MSILQKGRKADISEASYEDEATANALEEFLDSVPDDLLKSAKSMIRQCRDKGSFVSDRQRKFANDILATAQAVSEGALVGEPDPMTLQPSSIRASFPGVGVGYATHYEPIDLGDGLSAYVMGTGNNVKDKGHVAVRYRDRSHDLIIGKINETGRLEAQGFQRGANRISPTDLRIVQDAAFMACGKLWGSTPKAANRRTRGSKG
jgi:hypothetical protein